MQYRWKDLWNVLKRVRDGSGWQPRCKSSRISFPFFSFFFLEKKGGGREICGDFDRVREKKFAYPSGKYSNLRGLDGAEWSLSLSFS